MTDTNRRSSSAAPVAKVAAAGAGALATYLIAVVAHQLGQDWINTEVAGAAVGLVAFIAAYFKRP